MCHLLVFLEIRKAPPCTSSAAVTRTMTRRGGSLALLHQATPGALDPRKLFEFSIRGSTRECVRDGWVQRPRPESYLPLSTTKMAPRPPLDGVCLPCFTFSVPPLLLGWAMPGWVYSLAIMMQGLHGYVVFSRVVRECLVGVGGAGEHRITEERACYLATCFLPPSRYYCIIYTKSTSILNSFFVCWLFLLAFRRSSRTGFHTININIPPPLLRP